MESFEKEYWGQNSGRAERPVLVREPGVADRTLEDMYNLYPLSCTGFNWGSRGAGAEQLAVAILWDHTDGNRDLIDRYSNAFKLDIVAKWNPDHFNLSCGTIKAWLEFITG